VRLARGAGGQETAEAHVFHFQIFFDPVTRAFAPNAELLDPAEGRFRHRYDSLVDADDAGFDRLHGL
jgi:hypothetical protein